MANSSIPARTLTVVHHSSRRVTAGISFHSFYCPSSATSHEFSVGCPPGSSDNLSKATPGSPDTTRWPRATQNVAIQFPEDLDPISGHHGLGSDERRCIFTPCSLKKPSTLLGNHAVADTDEGQYGPALWLSILTRNGRITGLLGLPRPYQTLTAEIVEVGGGFPASIFESLSQGVPPNSSEDGREKHATCVAGGTGIAPFLTLDANQSCRCHLLWSIRSTDFGAVEFALHEKLLVPGQWAEVAIFVTSDQDAGEPAMEKPSEWWEQQFTRLLTDCPSKLRLWKRRMCADDLAEGKTCYKSGSVTTPDPGCVLFCGSKSLEWQIRLWSMGSASVYCTAMI